MKVLLHVTQPSMLRHFDTVILALAERGHRIRVASPVSPEDVPPPESLAGDDRVSFVAAPGRRGDDWAEPIHELRAFRDYLRYLEPRFDDAPKLRARAMRKMVSAVTRGESSHLIARCPRCDDRLVDDEVGRLMLGFRKSGRTNLARLFSLMEATIPSDSAIEAFLRAENPDVMLVTPLVTIGSYQADFVKTAKALGVPVGFPVFSWDNLSNKGLIHVMPDRVFVWNNRQRIEAVKMHGVPPEQVVVAGAPRFDEFFAMTPPTSREDFCAAHGLDPARPILTYLCSSEFVAGREVEFVTKWIDEIRQSAALEPSNILIRPHPRQHGQWRKFTTDRPRVAVSFPQSITSDRTLFDTLHHSAAVVGLNTSAELEAGIAGKPVFTILAPDFAEGQQGTIHFQYLLKQRGGFVELASDFDAHRAQLAAAVAQNYDASAIPAFIKDFLRPHGIDRPVTPIMVDAIEALAASRATPDEQTA